MPKASPGLRRVRSRPPELFVIINLPKRNTGTDANVPIRGVQKAAFRVRDGVEIVDGRAFEWGRNEVIAGVAAAGSSRASRWDPPSSWASSSGTSWASSTAEGRLAESEIWTDSALLQPAYQRGSSFQTVLARLESPEAFTAFKDALTTDPRVQVKVSRETDHYAEQSTMITTLITVLGYLVASLMGLGAVIGALNTMYSAVASRGREIATFRALGFHSGPVILAVLAESLVLALLGGLFGAGLAFVVFDGLRAATLNFQSFSQVAFSLNVTPGLLTSGVVYAVALGFLGGLFPAIRAARRPIATALREL